MSCQNSCETTCQSGCQGHGGSGYIILIVLYILLAIILGSCMFH